MNSIYLDYAATTPLSKNVQNVIIKSLLDEHGFGNSSSNTHSYGYQANSIIECSRKIIADTLSVLPREIIFTSGATESNNLAVKGVAENYKNKGNHIITSKIEHKAVLDVCQFLETKGFFITYLQPDKHGNLSISDLEKAITDKTILISLMAVNNELGTKNKLLKIGQIAKNHKIIFHVDAAQGYGKIDIDINKMNIDLLSVSAHKIYGPKGVGFLYVRSKAPKIKLQKQIHGGSQEFGIRSGTLPNHQIVGLAEAAKNIFENFDENSQYIHNLRKLFLKELEHIQGFKINTDLNNSYTGILNITFIGVNGETLLAMLDGIAMSMGSACNSSAIVPSHVLTSIGLNSDEASATVRVSFGIMTTFDEIKYVTMKIANKVNLLRSLQRFEGSVHV